MKKEALICALLLSTPALALANGSLATIKHEALNAGKDLVAAKFRSESIFASSVWRQDPVTGEWKDVAADVFYRLSFLAAGKQDGDYAYDGLGDLDYEVVIEKVDVKTGESETLDSTYYAKQGRGKKISFFDCDSTARCTDDGATTKGVLFDVAGSPGTSGMKVDNRLGALFGLPEAKILFLGVK